MIDKANRRPRWLIPLLLGVVILLPVAFLAARRTLDTYSRKECERCQWLLKILHEGLYIDYRLGHDDMFPPDLKTLFLEREKHRVPGSLSFAGILKCPGSRTKIGELDEAEKWQDYIYINWSLYYGAKPVPPEYPLIYDKRLSNHRGKGINVVNVLGAVYWDPDARSIKEFAADHPEYKVPLPQ